MIPEKEINQRIASKLRRQGYLVKQEIYFNPVEIDIIVLDAVSLKLASYEIKLAGWKSVLKQAERRQKYCHYSYAVLPVKEKKNVDTKSFKEKGIGLIYFRNLKRGIKLFKELDPRDSGNINRVWKKTVYSKFSKEFALG